MSLAMRGFGDVAVRRLTPASLTWHAVWVQQLDGLRNTMPRAMHAVGGGRRGYTEQSDHDGNDDQIHVKTEVLRRRTLDGERQAAGGRRQAAGGRRQAAGDRRQAVDSTL